MSIAENFHDEWWDMMYRPDTERQKLLRQERKAVRNEIIWQEYQAGKTGAEIGEDMGLDESHVYRIIRKNRKEER